MSLRASLFRIYNAMQRRIAPGLKYSQDIYEEVLRSAVRPDTTWLDLGCGHQVLPSWRAEEERALVRQCRQLVGLDYVLEALRAHPTLKHRVRGDVTALPFADEAFDLVTANMVVEHLAQPVIQFREIRRILRPGGVFLFDTPRVSAIAPRWRGWRPTASSATWRTCSTGGRVRLGRNTDDRLDRHDRHGAPARRPGACLASVADDPAVSRPAHQHDRHHDQGRRG